MCSWKWDGSPPINLTRLNLQMLTLQQIEITFLEGIRECLRFLYVSCCRKEKEAMVDTVIELMILGFIIGIILVVAFVIKWFIHFAE